MVTRIAKGMLEVENTTGLHWAAKPLFEPFPLYIDQDDVDLMPPLPSSADSPRFIRLTAGETGVGGYNYGALKNEATTGSGPTAQITAVIDYEQSPRNGATIHMINSERRFLRAGNPGTVQNDQMQGHRHTSGLVGSSGATGSGTMVSTAYQRGENNLGATTIVSDPSNDGSNGDPRIGNETRPKNLGVLYFMRIA